MAMILGFRDILDLPEWRPLAVSPAGDYAGRTVACDLRNNEDRHPELFYLVANTDLRTYNVKNDGWTYAGSPALAGAFAAGASAVFTPQRGPRGVIGTGGTPAQVPLATALPAAVGNNQLADRGDGIGFKVRILSKVAGKTEERYVVGNSAGATPTITLDSPLSFTPAANDQFEFLSGRVYLLGAGTVGAGIWKYYDVLTSSFSGNLATTGLPSAIGTHSVMLALDELYVPATRNPGEGFCGLLTAGAATATTLTGRATGADANLVANEFRNFQIRIVNDPAAPGSVGQRRKITSHTAGPAVVYTVPTWTVIPSASAEYVIEMTNEILLWTSASVSTYTYAQDAITGGQAADSWSVTTYAARPVAPGAGVVAFGSHGLAELDPQKNARYSFIYSFRGNGTRSLDVLDLAGGPTGTWTGDAPYGGASTSGVTFTTGTCGVPDPVTNGGRYAYLTLNGSSAYHRFNLLHRTLQPWAQLRFAPGSVYQSGKLGFTSLADGPVKVGFLYAIRSGGVEMFQSLLQR